MFAYIGDSQDDLERLYESLKKAAEYDATETNSKSKRHGDGWGCAILTEDGLTHYRTKTAIFEDDFNIPEIRGRTYAIFHARKASAKSPKGAPIFSHPFTADAEGKILFLAHNGKLKGPFPGNTVDTEIALKIVAERGGLERALPELKAMTETALNLLLLEISRGEERAEIRYLNYWTPGCSAEHYRLYRRKMRGGSAVFSSTMDGDMKGTACAAGRAVRL
jgi:glutamine amidotransferase